MKVIALASALALTTSAAFAGNTMAPAEDAVVVPAVEGGEEMASGIGSNAAWIVPLVAIALVGAVVATQSD